jgi:hypothetical protein
MMGQHISGLSYNTGGATEKVFMLIYDLCKIQWDKLLLPVVFCNI